MSFLDSFATYLSCEPSLEWVGPDLLMSISESIEETAVQSIPKPSTLIAPMTAHLRPLANPLTILIPTGIVMTSIGYLLAKKLHTPHKNVAVEKEKEELDVDFENYIKQPFQNQTVETIDFLKEQICRVPNEEFELVVFLATESSVATALNLATRMMRLIFQAREKRATYDDIEQEYVVQGYWYSRFTISWYFLKTLRSELRKKRGLIINNFQDVHSKSAAILTFRAKDLFETTFGTHLFLIINVDDSPFEEESIGSSREKMLSKWLTEKLEPYVHPEVIEGIEKQLNKSVCVIQKESLATLLSA